MKTMFSLRLLINLSNFIAKSLLSKASLDMFGTLGICSAVLPSAPSSEQWWGCSDSAWQDVGDSPKLFLCCTFHVLQSVSVCQECPLFCSSLILASRCCLWQGAKGAARGPLPAQELYRVGAVSLG